jgi:hypothetical protein
MFVSRYPVHYLRQVKAVQAVVRKGSMEIKAVLGKVELFAVVPQESK